MIKNLLSKLITPLGWTLLVQVLLCLPGKDLPDTGDLHIPQLDKMIHLILFGGIVFFWAYYAYRKNSSPGRLKKLFFALFLLASFNGILMEFVQLYYIPGRNFEVWDMLLDTLGAGIAYGFCNIKLLKTTD